jgi:hypothetical protein
MYWSEIWVVRRKTRNEQKRLKWGFKVGVMSYGKGQKEK